MTKKKLSAYASKRKFNQTPEPKGKVHQKSKQTFFVIHKHDARSLHYDLRLEDEGVLKSWAIPKGPSTSPEEKHLAIQTEDHPYEYKDFEGVIPKGNYGAGGVIIWDRGTYINMKAPESLTESIKKGEIVILLKGEKLNGRYALIRTHLRGENSWLFFKMKDEYADPKHDIKKDKPNSVVSGKSIEQVTEEE